MKDMKMEKQAVIDNLMFVSPFTRDLLKMHLPHITNPEFIEELEKTCKSLVMNRLNEYNKLMEDMKERSIRAESLIERIQHYFSYAEHKNSPKMRFNMKEYQHGMSRLSDEEKSKVEKWLADNGGLDKYVFSVYNAG